MSRCFPFSSTGYSGKSSINDSLIVSIKQQEETEICIPDRLREKANSSDPKKDRKRERKEKKKDKKEKKQRKSDEKEKFRSAVESENQKHNDKSFKVDSFLKESNGKTSLEVLERSNLTEEHGRPVDPQNVSCSSDSTGNSGKRKRDPSPVSSIQGNGNIIRILLSSQKRDDPSTSQGRLLQPTVSQTTLVSKVQEPLRAPLIRTAALHSTSLHKLSKPSVSRTAVVSKAQEPVRAPLTSSAAPALHSMPHRTLLQPSVSPTVSIPKVKQPIRVPLTTTAPLQLFPREDNSLACQVKKIDPLPLREDPSTSGRTEAKKPEIKRLSSHEKKMLKRETLYEKLFENLVPPTMVTQLVAVQDDDDDWLFGKKDVERPPKRLRESDDLPCSASAVLQPCAHFLSDVGVYALPFTVPY